MSMILVHGNSPMSYNTLQTVSLHGSRNGYWRSILRRRRWCLSVENEWLHSPFKFLSTESLFHRFSHTKHLGLIIEHTLSWTPQVFSVCSRAAKKIGLLRRFRNRLSNLSTQFLNTTSIRPILEYASTAWCSLSQKDNEQLERIQRRAARLIVKEIPRSDTPHDLLLARSGLTPLESRRKFIRAVMAHKIVHLSLPPHLVPLAQQWIASHKNGQPTALRNKLSIRLPRPKTDYLKRSPFYASLSEWNKLAQYLKCSTSLSLFRKSLASSADWKKLQQNFVLSELSPFLPLIFTSVTYFLQAPFTALSVLFLSWPTSPPPPPPPPTFLTLCTSHLAIGLSRAK